MDPEVDLTPLKREMRQGVPHYKPGQHRAVLEGDAALLIYVDAMGYACIIPCERHHFGMWTTMGIAYRMSANGVGPGWRELRKNYKLSQASKKALDEASTA